LGVADVLEVKMAMDIQNLGSSTGPRATEVTQIAEATSVNQLAARRFVYDLTKHMNDCMPPRHSFMS